MASHTWKSFRLFVYLMLLLNCNFAICVTGYFPSRNVVINMKRKHKRYDCFVTIAFSFSYSIFIFPLRISRLIEPEFSLSYHSTHFADIFDSNRRKNRKRSIGFVAHAPLTFVTHITEDLYSIYISTVITRLPMKKYSRVISVMLCDNGLDKPFFHHTYHRKSQLSEVEIDIVVDDADSEKASGAFCAV